VVAAIAQAIADEPGATLESVSGGNVVRPGFSQELDSLRAITRDTKRYLAELETHERARTGIRSLRVGYNKVFGYYLEVSKPNLSLVPDDDERRQTLVGGERFVTPQLKEYETRILTAHERIGEIEAQVFRQVCGQVAAASGQVLALASAVAELDAAVAREVREKRRRLRAGRDDSNDVAHRPRGRGARSGGRPPELDRHVGVRRCRGREVGGPKERAEAPVRVGRAVDPAAVGRRCRGEVGVG
jgi:DNA mismatch repair protein MutS